MNINRKEFVEVITRELGGGMLAELDAETLWLFHCELNSVQKKDRAEVAYKMSQVQKEAIDRAAQRQKIRSLPENGFWLTARKLEGYKDPTLPLICNMDGDYYELKAINGKSIIMLFDKGFWNDEEKS